MAEPMKNIFNSETLNEIALSVRSIYSEFRTEDFVRSVMDETWNDLELMSRCRKINVAFREYLPQDYNDAVSILEKALADIRYAFFFPDFITAFGQGENYWDVSISVLERNTERWSAEFAVRPFIISNEKKMMDRMYEWSKHENEHVRRLSSEGCRPLLPWGMVLTGFVKDPSPILPILEQLKEDPSKYVMKSVANNLNDISKDHPELVIKIAREWYGRNERTDWILKHGCRTLLKKGNRDVLDLFGYHDVSAIDISNLTLDKTTASIGDDVTFSFIIGTKKATKVRMEYGIDFVKSNGKRNRKIFQISEISLNEGDLRKYVKKHSFANVSVRKHYPGTHSITLIVNGVEHGTLDFELNA